MNGMRELELLGQTTIFDYLDVQDEVVIELEDKVRIDISNSDEQSVDYFKHYYPHVINKSGIVRDKKYISSGYMLYLVDVREELHWMNENEVVKVE